MPCVFLCPLSAIAAAASSSSSATRVQLPSAAMRISTPRCITRCSPGAVATRLRAIEEGGVLEPAKELPATESATSPANAVAPGEPSPASCEWERGGAYCRCCQLPVFLPLLLAPAMLSCWRLPRWGTVVGVPPLLRCEPRDTPEARNASAATTSFGS